MSILQQLAIFDATTYLAVSMMLELDRDFEYSFAVDYTTNANEDVAVLKMTAKSSYLPDGFGAIAKISSNQLENTRDEDVKAIEKQLGEYVSKALEKIKATPAKLNVDEGAE